MSLHKSKLPDAENCPIRDVIDRIGDRWSMLVMLELVSGPLRFGELAARVPDISERMLVKTLRGLEEDGLVGRKVHAEVPPRVEYALTATGHSMQPAIRAMIDWAEEHHDAIRAARKAYAERTG